MNKKAKKIIFSIVGFIILLLLTIFLIEQYQKKKEQDIWVERELKIREFEKKNEELNKIIQKAVHIDFKGVENDSLIFVIENKTNQLIKNVQYEGYFKDDFGTNLESNRCPFFYNAISKELAISPNSKFETSISFNDISKVVYFDIKRYKNNFHIEFETTQFTLVNGKQFSANWTYQDMPYAENNGPQKDISYIKKLLK